MVKCEKCHDNTDENHFLMRKCRHIVCHNCCFNYVQEEIVDEIKIRIKCPIETCQEWIADRFIRQCLCNHQMEMYECQLVLASSASSKKCLAKNCPSIVETGARKDLIYICTYCQQPNCLRCDQLHYEDQCGQVDNDHQMVFEKAAEESIRERNQESLLNQFKKEEFIPNPNEFICPVCTNFILPRDGIMMRNCYHCFCKMCFKEVMKDVQSLNQLKCSECQKDIADCEVKSLIGPRQLSLLIGKVAAPKNYCCKYPDCTGLWLCKAITGVFTCPVCKHVNCLECKNVHEGMSCREFRKTKRYLQTQVHEKVLKNIPKITCNCGKVIVIKEGGCGAIQCDNCNNYTCMFTGKVPGNKGKNSCGCTPKAPCHDDCKFGCFPEKK